MQSLGLGPLLRRVIALNGISYVGEDWNGFLVMNEAALCEEQLFLSFLLKARISPEANNLVTNAYSQPKCLE